MISCWGFRPSETQSTNLQMATSLFASVLVVLLLRVCCPVSARPNSIPSNAVANPHPSLSQELAAILHHHTWSKPSLRTESHQQVVETTRYIDQLAALDDNTPVSKRAAAACRIAHLIFPGRVSAANDPDYQSEREVNWCAYTTPQIELLRCVVLTNGLQVSDMLAASRMFHAA